MNQYRQKLNKLSWYSFVEDTPQYINLCFVFKSSGANKTEIETVFDEYMKVGEDYDEVDRKELIEYLLRKACE